MRKWKINPVKTGLIAALCLFLVLLLFLAVSTPGTVPAVSRGVPVPILMYHSVGYNNKVQSRYMVSPEVFEGDLVWLREHGYTAVFVSDLIRYTEGTGSLPEKPVVITLDDGFLNNLTYVLPLLEKYDMKAVVSVVGKFCDDATEQKDPNPAYAYLTWEDVETLARSGRVEIGNHTYDMHAVGERRGCMRRADESASAYSAALESDLTRLQSRLEEHISEAPEVFTYPYGAVSQEAVLVLQSLGFRAALTCTEKVNYISSSSPESLFRLGRFNRPAGEETKTFMKRILGDV